MPNTWTDEQIERWTKDGEVDIVSKVSFRWTSFSIALVSGTATYTFNERIYKPTSITWKGRPLDPLIGLEPHAMDFKFRDRQGEPRFYQMSNDGVSIIRLIPVPNEDLSQGTNLYSTDIDSSFIIRAYVYPDRSSSNLELPDYLTKEAIKAYVLYRAFSTEGIGQNLNASEYWKSYYDSQIRLMRIARDNLYATRERIDDPIPQPRRFARTHFFYDNPISAPVGEILFGQSDSLNNWNDDVSILSEIGIGITTEDDDPLTTEDGDVIIPE